MSNKYKTIVLGLILVILVGCSSDKTTPVAVVGGSDAYVSAALDVSYEGALSARNQLALGIVELDGTDYAVTAEQATSLLPLWQALRGTTRSGASAAAEVDALLSQIEEMLTAEQLQAIVELRLTQDDLRAWASDQGISLGSGAGAGGGMGAGEGRLLTEEERAARQAVNGGTGGGGLSAALLDEVIALLESRP